MLPCFQVRVADRGGRVGGEAGPAPLGILLLLPATGGVMTAQVKGMVDSVVYFTYNCYADPEAEASAWS